MISLAVRAETWPLAGSFTISRGSRTEARVVVAEISEDGVVGRGECVPYAHYAEHANVHKVEVRNVALSVAEPLPDRNSPCHCKGVAEQHHVDHSSADPDTTESFGKLSVCGIHFTKLSRSARSSAAAFEAVQQRDETALSTN